MRRTAPSRLAFFTFHFSLFTCFTLAFGGPSQAATLTWDIVQGDGATITGGIGTWTNGGVNWNTGAGDTTWNNATPDNAVFGGTAGTVTLGSNITTGGATSILFNSSGYTIAQDGGNLFALTMGTGGVNLSTGVTATINAKLTGSNAWSAVRNSGNGTLTIGGSVANDSTGTITTALPGHLILAKTGGVAATAGNLVIANNPVQLQVGDQSIGGTTTFQTGFNARLHPRGNTFTTRGLISAVGNVGVIENSGVGQTGGSDLQNGAGTVKIVTQSGDSWSYGTLIRDTDAGGGGTLAIVKDGDGTQTFTGTQYLGFTGGMSINGGTMVYNLASLGGGSQNLRSNTINAAGTFELTNTNTGIDNGTGLLNGTFSGAGTINKTGAGYVDFWGGGSGSNLSAFAGTINVSAGTLASNGAVWNAASSVALNVATTFDVRTGNVIIDKLTGSGTITTSFNSGNLLTVGTAGGSSSFGGVIQNGTATLPLTKSGGGTLTLTGTNTYTGTTTINGGILQVGNGAATGQIGNNTAGATVNASGTLTYFRSDSSLNVGNAISGTGNLRFKGTGGLTQSSYNPTANNTGFTGTLTVDTARLAVDNANDVGGVGSTIAVLSGGQVWINGAVTIARPVTIAGDGWLEGSGLLGALRLDSGANYSGAVTLSSAAKINSHTATGTVSGTINNSGNTLTLSTTNTGALVASNVISGSGGLIASGSGGTITLSSASNSYTGGTTISRGTLSATGINQLTTNANKDLVFGDANTAGANLKLSMNGNFLLRDVTTTANATSSNTLEIASFTGTLSINSVSLNNALTISSTGGGLADTQMTATSSVITGGTGAGNDALIFNMAGGQTIRSSLAAATAPGAINFIGNVHLTGNGMWQMQNTSYILNDAAHQNLWIPDTSSVTVDSNVTWAIKHGVETIDGLNGGGTVRGVSGTAYLAGAPILTVGAGNGSGAFSGVMQDNGSVAFSLTKTGSGTQSISGANAYTGATNVTAGTLSLTGSLSGSSVSTSSTGVVSETGTGSIAGAGVSFTQGSSGTSTLAGTNSYGGATTVNNGILQITGSASNTTTGNTNVNNGELQLGKTAGQNAIGSNNLFVGDGSGAAASAIAKLLLSNQLPDTTDMTIYSDGKFDLNSQDETINNLLDGAPAGGTVDGTSGSPTFTVQGGSFSGVITDTAGTLKLVKSGSNNLQLAGANTYAGATDIQQVILAIGSGNDRLPTTTTVTLGNGTTSGKLRLAELSSPTSRNQEIAGLLKSGTGTTNRVVGGAAGTSVLTVNIASGTNTYDGFLGGPSTNENNLALTKSGVGTLTLTANNTYSGATSVSQGTLRVNGTHTGGGLYTVANGAELGGSGTINAAVNILAGGITSPGNSPGTLTVASLDYDIGALHDWEVNGAFVNDIVNVTGLLNFDGAMTINVYNLG